MGNHFPMPQNHPQLISALATTGMNQKQCTLYIAALGLGTVPASRIATAAGINRATAYQLLDEMVRLGFMIASERFSVRQFTAVAPIKLPEIVEQQRAALTLRQHRLTELVSELEELRNPHTVQPTVRFYEGRAGLQDMSRHTLSATGDVVAFTGTQEPDEEYVRFLHHEYLPERVRRGIRLKVIVDALTPQFIAGASKEALREVRVLPDIAFKGQINVYNDTTMIVSSAPTELFGVEIESPHIASMLRNLFQALWKTLPAKPVKKATKSSRIRQR